MALNQKKLWQIFLHEITFVWGNLSLIQKVMFVFAPVFFCFFLIVGLIAERILVAQIVENMEESISILTIDEASSSLCGNSKSRFGPQTLNSVSNPHHFSFLSLKTKRYLG
jgi:hypothetical protein